MYSDPFPGCISKLFTSVPTGRAPSGYASPSFADTVQENGIIIIFFNLVTDILVDKPSALVKVFTCHASNDCRCFDDISGLHVLCRNDPSFSVASSYQCNVSRSTRTRLGVQNLQSAGSSRVWKLISPAGVVSHFHHLLFEGPILFARFIIQPLKVNHSVSLFVASADAMRPNLSWVTKIEMIIRNRATRRWHGENMLSQILVHQFKSCSKLFNKYANVHLDKNDFILWQIKKNSKSLHDMKHMTLKSYLCNLCLQSSSYQLAW